MGKYNHNVIAQLSHQMRFAPVRLRLKQLDAIEHLIDIIDPASSYPYEYVCHQITSYQPKADLSQKLLAGKTLIEDLVQLVEELSAHPILPAGIVHPCWTTEEVAGRLKVSTKTICRWRKRGMPGRKLRYPDGTVRLAFLERSIRRFVCKHQDLVQRGAAFKQLTNTEKKRIVELARETLGERRVKLHELSQIIAGKTGRAVETVRYTLRRYDQAHPDKALFGKDHQPVVSEEFQAIYDADQAGESVESIAKRFDRSSDEICRIVREVRGRLLKARKIAYIHNDEFETSDADKRILDKPLAAAAPQAKRVRPPADLPPYLQALYRQPLLTGDQERKLFRRFNYLKFKADRARKSIDVLAATDQQLNEIDDLLAQADAVKNEILKANLRLVVSIARRHVGRAPSFFETVSDGNISLMRAVEKFDYSRGFKFSTYASWAIMRNYARTVPEQMYHPNRVVTGAEETLAAAPAPETAAEDVARDSARHLISKGLNLLTPRERDIVVKHYGIGKEKSPMTLDQIGSVFGVTKERIRQIERKALDKLRGAIGHAEEDFLEG